MSNPAETYESYMVPALFAPWASRLVACAGLKPGERVLDLACGTGIVGRMAAAHGSRPSVVGIDANPQMLSVARTMAAREGHAIEWREGRAEDLPFPDTSFDVVLCQQALQFIADRHRALGQVRRVLTRGGRFVLSVWQSLDRHPFYQSLHEVISRRLGMSGVQEIFALGDVETLQTLLASSGFRQVAVESASMTARFPDPAGFIAGEIDVDTAAIPSMQHLDDAARQTVAAAIREEIEPALREVTEANHVVITFHAHLVRAERFV